MGAEIAIVLLLILVNGFFAMSELAIVSARRARLRQLADEDNAGAKLVLGLAEDPSRFLSIVQIGMTLNSVLAGAYSGATLAGRLGDYLNGIAWIAPDGNAVALALTVAGVTYLNLVIGELVPKRIGLAYAEKIAVRVAHAMGIFAAIAAPVVWLLKQSTETVLYLLRLHNTPQAGVTEEEVRNVIAEGTQSGALKPAEQSMLEGVMRLADRSVRTIMTPRMDVVWLNIDDTPRDHKNIIRSSGYSRFPVARGDMEEILGVVHAKDLLNASFDGATLSLKPVMRPALAVPDTTPVLRLLEQFKKSGQHIALVVDEYGSVEGLVSVTDIIESITGGLPERGREGTEKPVRREDGSWLIDGMVPIDEIEALTGLKDMRGDGDFQTLGGFIIERLGRIPATGDHFVWEDAHFEVVDMDGRRVDKVILMPPAEESDRASGEDR
ncbi:MAG: HlyC/CorC family transporter [Alphaproteobacteria bacterium]|nr:HlyC/CorC family transporter [Alphaproteobacteria bacterium]